MNKNKIINYIKNTEKIILFKNFRDNNLINDLKNVFSGAKTSQTDLSNLIFKLVDCSLTKGIKGDLWQNYLKSVIINSENIFSLKCEKNEIEKNTTLYKLALHDIKIITKLFSFNINNLINSLDIDIELDLSQFVLANSEINNNLNEEYNKLFKFSAAKDNLNNLVSFYSNYGAGILNKSKAFYWKNNSIKAVNNPDPINFSDLVSYQKSKKKLLENTEIFLKGFKAHNVLLYGDSGTGKSSSVKALLNKYYQDGLRLIEINSSQIKELPAILEYLNERGLYFIIFMDDLSFEEFETEYKYLKAVMEGGIESRPNNVLFYATSNRRHLVREKWQDRESEIHENDILNEKLSLAERFGLTLMFNKPNKKEYLKIVKQLAAKENIKLADNILEEKALKWSKWNNGRSGRSARQFINQLLQK